MSVVEPREARLREQLHVDGYVHLHSVLDAQVLDATRGLVRDALARVSPAHRAAYRSEGSLIPVADHPRFSSLVADSGLHAAFARLGLGDTRFSSGYVISKPPGGPALFWHQDWWGWDHPISFTDQPFQVFVFIYTSDTSPRNGCLRVIPGTHRQRHALHDLLAAHSEDLARVEDAHDPAFARHPDERAVPVRAGDVVIGDARLIHGAYANASDAERTCVTLWFHPDYPTLPESIRSRLQQIFLRHDVDTDADAGPRLCPAEWPAPHRERVAGLCVDYAGSAEPQAWNRLPPGGPLRGA